MRSADHLTVFCVVLLLLLYTALSVPTVLLSMMWQNPLTAARDAAAAATAAAPSSAQQHKGAPALSTNYASAFLGASVVSVEPASCHGGSALISDNPDKYVLCPCAAPRKQFTLQLIRDVEVRTVVVRNAEHFSSGVRNFTLLGSRRYPTATWEVLGAFEAEQRRGRQFFHVAPHSPVRYVKLQWATSHGTEPWCTITSFQVYGMDVLETLTRFGEDEEEEPEGAVAAVVRETAPRAAQHIPPVPTLLVPPATVPPPSSLDLDGLRSVGEREETEGLDVETLLHFSSSPGNATCTPILPVGWNDSLRCPPGDFYILWQPCAESVMCGLSEYAGDCIGIDDGCAAASATAVATTTQALGGTTSLLARKTPLYQSAAGSLLTQLLRQQRAQTQELASLLDHEKQLTQELNHTRWLLSSFYARYRETVKDVNELRDRLRELEVEMQRLQLRLLVRERGGGPDAGGATTRNDTTIAVAAFVLSTAALIVAFVSVTASTQQLAGSPTRWGRQFSVSGEGGRQ